jgi:hypothetical protein
MKKLRPIGETDFGSASRPPVMPAAGALFALLFVATIAGTIGLWYAIDSETDDPPQMERTDAERAVRQDTDDGEGRDTDGDDTDDDWGSDSEWGVEERERR